MKISIEFQLNTFFIVNNNYSQLFNNIDNSNTNNSSNSSKWTDLKKAAAAMFETRERKKEKLFPYRAQN